MDNQQTLDFLSRLWDLFGTVREGAAYLAGHPENAQLKTDVPAGLQALCTHLRAAISCEPEPEGLTDSVCAILQALAAEAGEGNVDTAKLNQMVSALTDLLAQEYIYRTEPEQYLSKEEAEPIFNTKH